ncbi:alkaline phosphatase [Pseudoalteromonas ulvae]|uniref:Alkaline phosphatase n=1 Tax=Pseudoalteromonas ulvae TaxID=107327 RepID=A0A244CKT8_PSEDV|nr:alkaline phosphatase [Pseudoalteromonas ulvae]OUL55987.1 alkaline phosphatase [Pseudoalteromonas ulvae]
MKKLTLLSVAVTVALAGCSGDDGKNGQNGIDGTNGLSSLVLQTQLAVGDTVCRNGGVKIDSGLDADSNGALSTDEVSSTEHVCAPTITSLSSNDVAVTANNTWFTEGENQVAAAKSLAAKIAKESGKAKNVILFVGDGMGISTVTAARILEGQSKGKLGEEHSLSFDTMPFSGFSKTYNVDAQTPDSAGTMTAMIAGVKTDIGVVGVAEGAERGSCLSTKGQELVSAAELAELAGKSTGIISTARITHATPASAYAKSADRNWEDVSDMPESEAENCEDIASQLVNFEKNLEARFMGVDVDGLDVVMGGGRRHFLPKDAAFNSADAVSAVEGDRTDGRDLTAEWQAQYPMGQYVMDQTGFDAINPALTNKVFALFNESHMQYEADRKNDIAGEPSLSEMTAKAIDILDNNDKGFFLTVEAGRIDHGHHAGNAHAALTDTIEFSKAVQAAMNATSDEDTLIIVTADHSHVFTIAGYPKRGNPILGKVVGIGKDQPSLAADGMPYTTVGYSNGGGFKDLGSEADADEGYYHSVVAGRVDLTAVDTTAPGFFQEAMVPLSSETHAGEDVGIYASGPGAHLVTGTNEQSYIFHVMDYAADLVKKADAAVQ